MIVSVIIVAVFCQTSLPSREQAIRDYYEIKALLDEADQLPEAKRWFSPQSQEAERRLNSMSPEQRQLFDQVDNEQTQKTIKDAEERKLASRTPESKLFSKRSNTVIWVLCVGGFILVTLIGSKIKPPNYGPSFVGRLAAEGAVTTKLFLLGVLLVIGLLFVGPCILCCIDPTIH